MERKPHQNSTQTIILNKRRRNQLQQNTLWGYLFINEIFYIKLKQKMFKIGRDPEQNSLCIDDQRISRVHCEILYDNKAATIKNMSSNDIIINGKLYQKGQQTTLKDNDVIYLLDLDKTTEKITFCCVFNFCNEETFLRKPQQAYKQLKFVAQNSKPICSEAIMQSAADCICNSSQETILKYNYFQKTQENKCKVLTSVIFDTNIFLIQLDKLQYKAQQVSGDPIICKCGAAFNFFSKYDKQQEIWSCEFCFNQNKMSISNEELVEYCRNATLQYFLPKDLHQKEEEKSQLNQSSPMKNTPSEKILIFCIDISASMQEKRINYVKDSLISAIEHLSEKQPLQKVCLIIFSDVVKMIGDGFIQEAGISQEQLNSIDEIEKIACLFYQQQFKVITQTKNRLKEIINNIKVCGCTNLGAGLLSSVCSNQGSIVYLCTDGEANAGVGGLVGNPNTQLYKEIGNRALKQSVTVHTITFSNSQSNTKIISTATQISGGQIEIIDEAFYKQNVFLDLIKQQPIASNAEINIILPKNINFKTSQQDEAILQKKVGNIFSGGAPLTFQYRINEDFKECQQKQFPFQLQVTFTMNNINLMRILTLQMNIGQEPQNINTQVLITNAIQLTANLAENGQFGYAKNLLKMWSKIIKDDEQQQLMMQDMLEKFSMLYRKKKQDGQNFVQKDNMTQIIHQAKTTCIIKRK